MSSLRIALIAGCGLIIAAGAANAQCVRKGAEATSGTEESAKWFVMETMVQSVSWGLWPGFLANGKVEGYTIKNEKYKCKKSGFSVNCVGAATFCKTK